jgi:hypothetical protein
MEEVVAELAARLAMGQPLGVGATVLVYTGAGDGPRTTRAVVRRVDPGPPARLRLEWAGGGGWRALRLVERPPGFDLGPAASLGLQPRSTGAVPRCVGRAALATALAARGLALRLEEAEALAALAAVGEGEEAPLDYDRVRALLNGEPAAALPPQPESQPRPEDGVVAMARTASADERRQRLAADVAAREADVAAAADATALVATNREVAALRRVYDWTAFEAAAEDNAVDLIVHRANKPAAHGRVLKLDGHRVRVDFSPSGGRPAWSTKRDLHIMRGLF